MQYGDTYTYMFVFNFNEVYIILIQYDMYVPAGISSTSYTAGISNPLVTGL